MKVKFYELQTNILNLLVSKLKFSFHPTINVHWQIGHYELMTFTGMDSVWLSLIFKAKLHIKHCIALKMEFLWGALGGYLGQDPRGGQETFLATIFNSKLPPALSLFFGSRYKMKSNWWGILKEPQGFYYIFCIIMYWFQLMWSEQIALFKW